MRDDTRLSVGTAATMLFLWGWIAATTPVAASTYVKTSDGDRPEPVVAVDNVCAWPNLTMLDDGTIAATIFNQPNHGLTEGDVEVWTSVNGGQAWQYAGTPAQHDPGTIRMNVAAGKAQNGDLLVIASGWGYAPAPYRDAILDPWLCRSSDGGTTWSVDKTAVPNRSPDGYPVVPFGDIVEGDDGVLRAAVYSWPSPRNERALIIQSQDDGLTWDNGFVPLDEDNLRNETALLNTGGDNWIAAARTADDASLAFYASTDNGQVWQPRGRITGGSQHPGHFLEMQDGRILLTYGDRTGTVHGVEVLVSSDQGDTWSGPLRVMDYTGDGGYPSSVQLPDGQILTAYYANAIEGHNRYHMGVVTWDPDMSIPEPGVLVEHVGPTDPTAEGFFLNDVDSSSIWTDAQSASPAGRLQEVSDSVGHYQANISPLNFANSEGWTATAVMKLNDNPSDVRFNTALEIDDGQSTWGLHFLGGPDATEVGVFASGDYIGDGAFEKIELETSVDPTDDFHAYQIIYDPAGDEGNGSVTFYLDGTAIGTQTRDEVFGNGLSRIVFGDNASIGSPASDALWSLVRLEIGQHVFQQGPIPGDANEDGIVNDEDASILAAHWQQTGMGWGDGDFNEDGLVNDEDASILAAHWQESQEGATPAPEPSTIVLLAAAGLAVVVVRRHRLGFRR